MPQPLSHRAARGIGGVAKNDTETRKTNDVQNYRRDKVRSGFCKPERNIPGGYRDKKCSTKYDPDLHGVIEVPRELKLVTCKISESGSWASGLGRHLDDTSKQTLSDILEVKPSDLLMFAAGPHFQPHTVLGQARLKCADILESKGVTVKQQGFKFLWVDTFPLFLPREDGGEGLESAHHPFTAPHPEDLKLIFQSPELVRSQHYDLVLNGSEIGGGSIRIHNSKLQRYVLTEVLKQDSSELKHLLEALESGCPPHGGIALGLDRLMAIMVGADSIRDVIAFPKITQGKDPLSNSPAPVAQKDLDYYHIKVNTEAPKDSESDGSQIDS